MDKRTKDKLFDDLSLGFVYLAARLARQWTNKQRISCLALRLWFVYLAARLARQWMMIQMVDRPNMTPTAQDKKTMTFKALL